MGVEVEKNEYPKALKQLVSGALITYIGGIFLLIAFCSPYWVKSFELTFSSFKNMGLWMYCFKDFRFPAYQFDHLFDGCHSVFSEEYFIIREWLMPGWILAVQTFVTISFLLSFGAQAIMACQLCRWPLEFVLQYEWILTVINFIAVTITAAFMFFAVLIFGLSYTRRDWLMYPNWNILSWSYGFAVLASLFHAAAAVHLYYASRKSYDLRRESRNLIMQMHPISQHRLGW